MKLNTLPISRVKKGMRVLMRIDANVPVERGRLKKGSDARLQLILPEIEALAKRGAVVILLSHLGRPGGKVVPELSLKPVARRLSLLLNRTVYFVESLPTDVQPGDIYLLENVRFSKEEEQNGKVFAKQLAGMGDVYVNNAFAVSHRKHASVSAITAFLPSYAGNLLAREVAELSKPMKSPFVILLGGIKLETKLPLLKRLASQANVMLFGSGYIPVAHRIKKQFGEKVVLPIDIKKQKHTEDIGPETIELYTQMLRGAKSVLWNGPLGTVEQRGGERGTYAMAEIVATLKGARTVIGGGDTLAFLERKKLLDNYSFVSTGGGAMLAFLAGEQMPGITPLLKK